MEEEDLYFVESSQDEEIELQIRPSNSPGLTCLFPLSNIDPSSASLTMAQSKANTHSSPCQDTFHPESQDASSPSYSHSEAATQSVPYGHHCNSQEYYADFERPTPPSSGHHEHEASTYEIFKTIKSNYKATCMECDIPYESQPTLPESFVQHDYEHEESQPEPPALTTSTTTGPTLKLLSQVSKTEQHDSDQEEDSKSVNQNLAKDKDTCLKTKLNIRSPTFPPLSSSYTLSPISRRHRAAGRARRH